MLVQCKECKEVVSSTAVRCPHCGYRYSQIDIRQMLYANARLFVIGFTTTAVVCLIVWLWFVWPGNNWLTQ